MKKGKPREKRYNENRNTPIEKKESYKWLKSYQTLCEIEKSNPNFHLVSVCDREEVAIKPPRGLLNRSQYSNINLYAVTTTEINPPKGKEPIHWFILTTIPVLNYKDAFEKIEWYRQRWVIEIFFKTLKSGCKIEDYQFQTFERLKRILAIDSIIAWRIYFLQLLEENVLTYRHLFYSKSMNGKHFTQESL